MLARTTYSAAEVAPARSAMANDPDRVRSVPGDGAADLVPALVIVLDAQFLHRMRGAEAKASDSPLKQARSRAEQAVTGEAVDLDLAGFQALAVAFYAELAVRFPPDRGASIRPAPAGRSAPRVRARTLPTQTPAQ